MDNLEHISHSISEKGLKVTQQRIVVYQAILDTVKHPSAEEIYEKVRKTNPSISLATVYKTLETFTEAGLVKRVSTPKGNMRYDANVSKHNHIYVTNTNEIIDYFDEELSDIIASYMKNKNIKNLNITDIRLHIKGEKIDPVKDILIS